MKRNLLASLRKICAMNWVIEADSKISEGGTSVHLSNQLVTEETRKN